MAQLISRPYTQLPFATPLFYKYVRHPLYVGWLLAFWATPTATAAARAVCRRRQPGTFRRDSFRGEVWSPAHGVCTGLIRKTCRCCVADCIRYNIGTGAQRGGIRLRGAGGRLTTAEFFEMLRPVGSQLPRRHMVCVSFGKSVADGGRYR